MLNEELLIYNNIKKFKRLLKEYASRGDIADAIDNREILQIYYDGDYTERPGYRTIEPYALGFIKTKEGDGDLALRAWEQAGSSDSFKSKGKWAKNPPRMDHEKFVNKPIIDIKPPLKPKPPNIVPGWRLFKLKGILQSLPTGMHFPTIDPNTGKVQDLRPLYNPNDQQLSVINSVQPPSGAGDQEVTGTDSIDEPDKFTQKLSAFDAQSSKFKIDASNQEAMMIRNLMDKWKDIKEVQHKSPKDYLLINNKDGTYKVTNKTNAPRYNENEIVGNVFDLYQKYAIPDWKELNFFDQQKKLGQMADKRASEKNI